jgi:hypothetical protein
MTNEYDISLATPDDVAGIIAEGNYWMDRSKWAE